MRLVKWGALASANLICALLNCPGFAADYPAPQQADWIAHDFQFHTGEVMPEVKLHYRTVGDKTGEPVLILHGTAGSGANFLTPAYAGELFGAGQPLDARKYYIILPDAIGAGGSTKPSDGLRMKFPQYDYGDMVAAQYRLVKEGLGISHLRLVTGNSMGGMQTWIWGEQYPDFVDALVPMASLPTEMSGRNWMMRRFLVDSIRHEPDWDNGDYKTEPKNMALILAWFSTATSGGTRAYYKQAPTREQADKLVDERLGTPFTGDANDVLYQWQSSADYDPAPELEKINAAVLVINSADDERNPQELGIVEREIKHIRNARYYLIPASSETRGHGTTGAAKFWKDQFSEFLQSAPSR